MTRIHFLKLSKNLTLRCKKLRTYFYLVEYKHSTKIERKKQWEITVFQKIEKEVIIIM